MVLWILPRLSLIHICALTRAFAYANLNNRPIDLALAQESPKNIISVDAPVVITGELIQQVVADTYSIKVDEFKAKTRARTCLLYTSHQIF